MEVEYAGVAAEAAAIREAVRAGADRAGLGDTHASFRVRFPKLFAACCDPSFDLAHLAFMLEAASAMRANPSEAGVAEKQVYDRLKRQYVDPIEERLEEERRRARGDGEEKEKGSSP